MELNGGIFHCKLFAYRTNMMMSKMLNCLGPSTATKNSDDKTPWTSSGGSHGLKPILIGFLCFDVGFPWTFGEFPIFTPNTGPQSLLGADF